MKVLFLTKYPYEGASSRYRVFQYIPHLKEAGVECTTSSFMDAEMYAASFSHGQSLKKVWLTAKAVLRRIRALKAWRDYDVIYMQRELFPGPLLIAEKWLKKRGATLVFDYDDALFIPKPSQFNKLAGLLKSANKTLGIFKLSDCVIAGNNYLRDIAKQHAKNAVTLEVAEDTRRIKQRPRHTRTDQTVIGWLGSKTTVKYLGYIKESLLEIHHRYPQVTFEVMGGDPEFQIEGLPLQHFEWSLDGELEALARFDIGLMPLPQEEWSKGKSGGKARTYMAAGVVPVCTAIGYNLELIQNGKTGVLCTSQEEWLNSLDELIRSPSVRQEMSDASRKYVETHFDVKKQALALKEVLEKTLGKQD